MTRPRTALVCLADTPWYHIVSRCVRRAFLCGKDHYTGRCFEHRRGWIVDRIGQLSAVFAIDVAAYAVMSNHFHLVVRVDAERATNWSRDEVLRRWTQLFDGPPAVRDFLAARSDTPTAVTLHVIDRLVEKYRSRLTDLSWFMRVLNESIARQANAEDDVTGRFWEGRFKSQALLDEQAILSAMAYVDLNPIRAQMADTPERSEFTSVAERIAEVARAPSAGSPTTVRPSVSPSSPESAADASDSADMPHGETRPASLPKQPLMPFDATARLSAAIPFAFDDYLEVIETAGRCVRPDKRGAIPRQTPRLLERLGIAPDQFITCATSLMRQFGSAVGAPRNLTQLCAARQVKYLRGMAAAKEMFQRKAA
ncbi:transposase [Aromatoleum evansii]|uniref:Transposase n=1 Tax=Aromatoleum evansii TaxID=59406 RepID=A0ABZ1AKN4_AROEV|nr:transposase [Aromatoleum evansii]